MSKRQFASGASKVTIRLRRRNLTWTSQRCKLPYLRPNLHSENVRFVTKGNCALHVRP